MSQLTIPKNKPAPVPTPVVEGEIITPASAFAYGALAADVAEAAKAAAGRIHALTSKAKESCFEIGRELLAVKEKLEHGEFGKWIEAEFDMSQRTAQNYMSAAKLRDECETVSVLPQQIIYALAAPSVPPEVRTEIISQIESTPERPSADAIRHLINNAKRKHAEERREAEKLKGKTPAQIAKAKKAKEKREKEWKAEAEKRHVEQEARQQAAADFVAKLQELLPSDFPQLLEIAAKADCWSLGNALMNAGDGHGA